MLNQTVGLPDVKFGTGFSALALCVAVARAVLSTRETRRSLSAVSLHRDEIESEIHPASNRTRLNVERQLFVEQLEHAVLVRIGASCEIGS